MLEVATPDDWMALRQQGLLTVVDPMVYRAGEVFLQGRSGAGSNDDARSVWEALSKNIDGLMLFIDELMLNDRLPIFDYSTTYDDPPGLGVPEIVAQVNTQAEILVQVKVFFDASLAAREAAIEQLLRLPLVEDALAADLVSELSAFDFRWKPMLDQLGPLDKNARAVATFRYAGLLFAEYAVQLAEEWAPPDKQPEHVLQPKRSRLLLATAVAPDGALGTEETELFGRLRTLEQDGRSGIGGDEVNRAPTFLPYLLSKDPKSPQDLLRIALKERKSRDVLSYRELLARVRADLGNGRITKKTRDEIGGLADIIARKLAPKQRAAMRLKYSIPLSPAVLANAALTGGAAAALPNVALEGETDLNGVRDALALHNPKRPYRKLLTRLVTEEATYHSIDRRVKNLWAAA